MVTRLTGRGIPDLLVGWCGRWVLLECKTEAGKATEAQQVFHQETTRRGLPAYYVRTIGEVQTVLDRIVRLLP
jgi:hypothetical protein